MRVILQTAIMTLPDALKSFDDNQVSQSSFGTSGEYVRELIRKDQERLQLTDPKPERFFWAQLTQGHPPVAAATLPVISMQAMRICFFLRAG